MCTMCQSTAPNIPCLWYIVLSPCSRRGRFLWQRCKQGGREGNVVTTNSAYAALTQTCVNSPDLPGQLDVLGEQSDPLGMEGAEVGILHEQYQKCLCCLLQR